MTMPFSTPPDKAPANDLAKLHLWVMNVRCPPRLSPQRALRPYSLRQGVRTAGVVRFLPKFSFCFQNFVENKFVEMT